MDRDTDGSPRQDVSADHDGSATASHERLVAAMSYTARGYLCVPVPAGGKKPVLTAWQKLRLTVEQLAKHFEGEGNIGIILGEPSDGITDIDLDCPEAMELADRFLPPTPAVTGRPSAPRSHRWYIAAGAVTRQHRDSVTGDMVVELRSTGGQTLVGPSIHPETGERYDMLEGEPATVDAAHLSACVAALAEAVMRRRYPDRTPQPRATPAPEQPVPPAQVTADESALRRAEAYLDAIPGAISGFGGHPQTYSAAVAMVHGFGLDTETALRLLIERYNPRCQPPWTEKELRHKVDDAAAKPHQKPYGWLRDASHTSLRDSDPTAPNRDTANKPSPIFPCTDLGNAERLVARFGRDLRFCPQTGRWYCWDGRRWRDDDQSRPRFLAGLTARSILSEAGGCRDAKAREELAEWAIRSECKYAIDAMVSLASAQPEVTVRLEAMDGDSWALNVVNGTIDLRTGALRPHAREDLLTRIAPVEYAPRAPCPLFMTFLDRVFAGDQELIRYVQEFHGLCLTGDITQQILVIYHGVGNNGKNVLLDTISGIMGDYASPAPPNLIAETRHTEHPTEIADLMGRRLVIASETEDGAALRLQLVKRLTGDATLKGRFMRQDYFAFPRTHKMILVTNNKPRVKEDSVAAWRRLKLVPFSVVIPPEERDPHLLEKLTEEWPGILAWMVEGCIRFQEEGLGDPPAVVAATAAYQAGEDAISRFLDDCCGVVALGKDSPMFTPWRELSQEYKSWAANVGEAPDERRFREALDKRGFPSVTRRSNGRPTKGRAGIGLNTTPDERGE